MSVLTKVLREVITDIITGAIAERFLDLEDVQDSYMKIPDELGYLTSPDHNSTTRLFEHGGGVGLILFDPISRSNVLPPLVNQNGGTWYLHFDDVAGTISFQHAQTGGPGGVRTWHWTDPIAWPSSGVKMIFVLYNADDNANVPRLFYNGAEVGGRVEDNAPNGTPVYAAGTTTWASLYAGGIGDLLTVNDEFTAEDVAFAYSGHALPRSKVTNWYPLDEGAGTFANRIGEGAGSLTKVSDANWTYQSGRWWQ